MPLPHEYDKPRCALRERIVAEIAKNGPGCDLNHLDLSGVRNMDALFEGLPFNGDISAWDVSQVLTMKWMFKGTPFNGDISKWNTRGVVDMGAMFEGCAFQGDLAHWNVSGAHNKARMFMHTQFNGDLSRWDMSRTQQTFLMFAHSMFDRPIGMWDMRQARHTDDMFAFSAFNQDIGAWQLPSGGADGLLANSQYQGPVPTVGMRPSLPEKAVLDAAYRGDFQNKYTLDEARVLFGSVKARDTYLQERAQAGHPLDRLHIQQLAQNPRKPKWATKALRDWVRSEQGMHQALSLSEEQSMALLCNGYRQRFLGEAPPVLENVSFDFGGPP